MSNFPISGFQKLFTFDPNVIQSWKVVGLKCINSNDPVNGTLRFDGKKSPVIHVSPLDVMELIFYVHCTRGNKFKEDWLLQEVIRKLGENYLIHGLQNSNYFELSGWIACSKFDRKIIKCNWRVGVDYFPP